MMKIKKFFTLKEIRELIVSWILVGVTFSIAMGFSQDTLIFSLLGVGVAFIFHELAHKFTAIKFGAYAYYKYNLKWLGIGVLISFLGWIILAPGAVVIYGIHSKSRYGKIALAGPLANIILAGVFAGLNFFYPSTFFSFAFRINSWLAFFNMIPFAMLDGLKVKQWNKNVFWTVFILSIVLVFVGFV